MIKSTEGMRFHKELWYLVGSHELCFKLLIAYQAIASARKHIGVIFEVKKKKRKRDQILHDKTFTIKLFGFA